MITAFLLPLPQLTTLSLLEKRFLYLLTPVKRTAVLLIHAGMSRLVEGGRCNSFLIELGLGEDDLGPFKAVAGHLLQLVAILEEGAEVVDILIILFLDLVDSISDVSKPHLHLLDLHLAELILAEGLLVVVRVVGTVHLILLFKHSPN